ncbi:Protein indeterminate-domain 1 [Hibiscus syriacus]|uniref:Protein indeterminate-domain 1 n=1 Tax=Hibiscus syriacus TaxID=106335 RepID=A0A6A2Z547_HIBSY|nr:Protein indeterminate-domain 1 [Hibiscus syriacus]
MAEESISNGFMMNPVSGSNPPDPEAEVIALSPKTLMETNRFLCEICGKGFQRDQNLQLHRRGHNLPWKLKQRSTKEVRKRVKHGEKKWKCEKCEKRYAVQSDWKAHSKTCGTREYKCDCGTLFSRRDSFITHRAFCDALAEETARVNAASGMHSLAAAGNFNYQLMGNPLDFSTVFKPNISSSNDDAIDQTRRGFSLWMGQASQGQEIQQFGSLNPGSIYSDPLVSTTSNPPALDYQLNWVFGNMVSSGNADDHQVTTSVSLPVSNVKENRPQLVSVPSLFSTQHQSHQTPSFSMSATALLQKAAQIGATSTETSFLGSFGTKCSNSQDGNKYSDLYVSNIPTTTTANDISTLNRLQMYPTKRRRMQNEDGGGGGGETRDFLGVGIQAICQPSSINGWL